VVLLPVMHWFTGFVDRILPDRGSPLTRCLDPSALANPIVAVEAVRRTVARALGAACDCVEMALAIANCQETFRPGNKAVSVQEMAAALRQAGLHIGYERSARIGKQS
jgi:phosphate:Na+ symporter